MTLTLVPQGRLKGPLCGFSQIAPEVLGISFLNLSYLSGQPFHTLCQKIRSQVIIEQPWVTPEWRHVPPIFTNKNGWQEAPPRAQFLTYDQLSHMIWRRISRATKLLSRIFKISKLEIFQKISFFFFLKKSPQNQNFQQKKRTIC